MSTAPLTPRTNVTSPGLTTIAPLPEVEAVQEILLTMKGALGALGVNKKTCKTCYKETD